MWPKGDVQDIWAAPVRCCLRAPSCLPHQPRTEPQRAHGGEHVCSLRGGGWVQEMCLPGRELGVLGKSSSWGPLASDTLSVRGHLTVGDRSFLVSALRFPSL